MLDKTTEAGLMQMLRAHEGYKQFAYKDTVGKLTIGIGRNLVDNGLSLSEAIYLCKNDADFHYDQLNEHLAFFSDLDAPTKAALVDMSFNMGLNGLLAFIKMLNALSMGNRELAAVEAANSKWYYDVQPERRDDIIHILRTGTWPAYIA